LESLGTDAFTGAPILLTVLERIAANELVRKEATRTIGRAEAQRRAEAAIVAARVGVLDSLRKGQLPARTELLAADFKGITVSNIGKFEGELVNLRSPMLNIADIDLLARKVVIIELMSGEENSVRRISTHDLAAVGVTGMNSSFKITILYKIAAQPASLRRTYTEIDALAAKYLLQSQSRRDRLAAIIARAKSQ
jgi:hypothetical protein